MVNDGWWWRERSVSVDLREVEEEMEKWNRMEWRPGGERRDVEATFFSSFSFLCFFSWPPPPRLMWIWRAWSFFLFLLMFHEFCFCSTVYYFKLHYLFYSSAKTLHNFAAVLSCPFEFLCFFYILPLIVWVFQNFWPPLLCAFLPVFRNLALVLFSPAAFLFCSCWFFISNALHFCCSSCFSSICLLCWNCL